MEPAENRGFIYEFGKFVLDPRERTLYSDGTPVRLTTKEFETLLLLVVHNGKALSKDAMMSAIWQDAFVEESNLAKQISQLRKIFNTENESFIQTLPKHGYRFSADIRLAMPRVDESVMVQKRAVRRVTVAVEEENDQADAVLQLPAPGRSARGGLIAVAMAVILLAAAGIWFWTQRRTATSKPISTMAVLPLRSVNGSESERALALGLTDAFITKLGSLNGIAIRPLGSVTDFTDGTHDALELGRRLHVDAVLEGSLQQSDDRLRVYTRLVNAVTGEQIWSEKFDDSVSNAFEVQDRLSEQAARAVTATLAGAPTERLTKRYTDNAAAFDAFIKGRYYWNKRTEPDFRRAVEYFEQAVSLDPNYALAYSGLADTYILLAVWGTEPPNISLPKAKEAAVKALAADAGLAESHTSLAFIKWVYEWDFAAADREFNLALELNPNYATAHHWRAYYLVSMARNEEAIASIKSAQELEGPLSIGIMTDIGEIYLWSGAYDRALESLNDVVGREPGYAIAHYELGITYIKKGMARQGIDELERARQLEDSPRVTSVLAYAYGSAGETERAQMLIRELKDTAAQRYVSPFSLAVALAGVGNDEAAIDQLELAFAERSDAMAILMVHPLLTGLHANPRFRDLARRVGFPG